MKKESWDIAQWENTCLAYPGCWGQYPVSRGGGGGKGVIVGKFVFGICPFSFSFLFFLSFVVSACVHVCVCMCTHIYKCQNWITAVSLIDVYLTFETCSLTEP